MTGRVGYVVIAARGTRGGGGELWMQMFCTLRMNVDNH